MSDTPADAGLCGKRYVYNAAETGGVDSDHSFVPPIKKYGRQSLKKQVSDILGMKKSQ